MSNTHFRFERPQGLVKVNSPSVIYSDEKISSTFTYTTTNVVVDPAGGLTATPKEEMFLFETKRHVPKLGMMLVGWGGNNGSTITAGILANQKKLSWMTKQGKRTADYVGSLTQASSVKLGTDSAGNQVHVPFDSILPMVSPNEIVIGGWDISSMKLGDAMSRAQVLDVDLQRQLYDELNEMTPLPSIYYPDFIASNQADRADNVIGGTKSEQLKVLRQNIRDFKAKHDLDKVIVVWTANTERFCDVRGGPNGTADELLASIERNESEVSASTIFCVASLLEGCSFINGSPQNTFVPGTIELAERHGVHIAGDDFKSGQTKVKSVLVDFLVSSGIKPVSIVSYNHLGNNDGKNLSAPQQFRSKEISKSNVVDDMVASNGNLYSNGEHPDHTIVIKYVPYVGDSKRAMDEYTSEIFLGGKNTIAMHNTCEDSLLAAPLILDLVVLTELFERVSIKRGNCGEEGLHPILSLLSFLLKAPLVPENTPVVNALFAQRAAISNVMRACVGLPPVNHMMLDQRMRGAGRSKEALCASKCGVERAASSANEENVALSVNKQ